MSIVGLPRSGGARSQGPRARGDPVRAVRIPGAASSPSTSRRPTCPRTAAASTCRSRSASSPPAGRCRWRRCSEYEFLGELGLTGELRAVDGVLPAALAAAQAGRKLIVPAGNGAEAALARAGRSAHRAHAAGSLRDARSAASTLPHARARCRPLRAPRSGPAPTCAGRRTRGARWRSPRPAATTCCWSARRAAARPCSPRACRACCRKRARTKRWKPRRSPRSAAAASIRRAGASARFARRTTPRSAVALVGGGAEPRPGEISLAHNGVLFLDELPEWDRRALEVLREPLESGVVTVSRAARQREFPARFQLVAAMNPCPCGWAGDASGRCRCSCRGHPTAIARASPARCWIASTCMSMCRALPPAELRAGCARRRIERDVSARASPRRASDSSPAPASPTPCSSQAETIATCRLAPRRPARCSNARSTRLQLSARSLHRILRVARTIADLDDSDAIATPHLAEAIGYRTLDRGASTA